MKQKIMMKNLVATPSAAHPKVIRKESPPKAKKAVTPVKGLPSSSLGSQLNYNG